MEGSRFGLYHDLLLMAKVFSHPRLRGRPRRSRSGRLRDQLRPGRRLAARARRLARRHRARPARARNATWSIVGSGAGGAVAAATLAEAGLDVIVLEAGGHYNRDSYPSDPLEAIASLYRDGGLTIAEGRPPIPVPVAQGRRRHDGDQLGHLLPRARPGAGGLARRATASTGRATSTPTTPRPRSSCGSRRSTPSGWAATASSRWRERSARRQRRADLPQRRQLRAVQLLPLRLRDRRQARHARQLPAARGRRRGAAPRRRRGAPGPGRGRARGRRALLPARRRGNGRRRPYTVRARRATIVAGGALGTPELLLRSGLGGRQVGRNLHIHPACWVGARYEEEVRGWEGVMQSYYVDQWEPRAHPARGDLHAARLRRRLAARLRARAPGGDARLRPHRLDRRPPLRPLRRAASASPATARCGPPTS